MATGKSTGSYPISDITPLSATLENIILNNEIWVRSGSFAAVFAIMAIAELLAPARARRAPRSIRWVRNFTIMGLGAVTTRFLIPLLAVGAAFWADSRGIGLLNLLDWPRWLEVIIAIVLLDLAIYLQHLVMHHVPLLWRLHRTHHADAELDVTTGGRFHPIEIWLSMGIKMGVVVALGAPPAAVILFEVILSCMALFNHSNVALPRGLDRGLRLLIVTPAMHRVHHSPDKSETNSNFGFNLSVWDRLFTTYREAVRHPDSDFPIGLFSHRDPRYRQFLALLVDPFRTVPDTFPADGTTNDDQRIKP